MTIDEAIAHEREVAKEIYVEAMLYHANPNDEKLDGCIERDKYHEQLAEWLEELKFLRQWKSDVMNEFCKYDCNSVGEAIHNGYNKALDDFVNACKEDISCQTFGLHINGIERISEQLKAGDMDEEDFENACCDGKCRIYEKCEEVSDER